jgi:tRNA-specific 2-thiouridylase
MGIGGLKHASEAPWYVADKDLESNTLWACQGNDHPALFATGLETSDIFWIAGEAPCGLVSVFGKDPIPPA